MHIEKKTLRNIFIGVISCIVLYWFLNEGDRVSAVFKKIYSTFSPFFEFFFLFLFHRKCWFSIWQ